jgi:membrane-associated protein
MSYPRFLSFSVFGSTGWVFLLTMLGYGLGNVPLVRRNFDVAILAIIFVSLLPTFIEVVKAKRSSVRAAHQAGGE